MNYSGVKFYDMLDGPGLRVTLFVSGCSNNCKGCHNPETHDPNYGQEFTYETLKSIVEIMDDRCISGFTFCGGDPLYPSNIQPVLEIARTLKAIYGDDKSIWMYTGYTLSELESWNDDRVNELLDYVDVILEGRYIESLRSPDKHWVGSSNQQVMKIIHEDILTHQRSFIPYED